MAHPHSFKFCKKGSSDVHQINCNSSGTVLQALQTSDHFTKLVNNQTFFIERKKKSTDGVIADHFPCHLITKGELLHIHTFPEEKDQKDESTKVKDEGAQDAEDAQKTKPASGELITFTVASMGGKDTKIKDIVKNKKLQKFKTLCVYAYSEDTIADALKRDGRFADIVFYDKCELHDLNDKTKLEINQNVHALHGHSYEVCLPRGTPLKFTEKSDTEQKVIIKAESSVGDTESESREESTMTKSEKIDNQVKKTDSLTSRVKEIYGILRSQFPDLVEFMAEINPSERSKQYLQLMKEDFVERTRAFSTMCQVEKLVNLGTSVCTVKTANSQGTGFLLFDNFILTNAHVIEKSYDISFNILTSAATVNFNMGSGTSLDKEFPLCSDVFAFLKGEDDAGRYVDFALLKLYDSKEIMKNEDIPKLPRLLKEFTSNLHAGGICIIGHPGSELKRKDVSCIVPHTQTGSASGDSIQLSFSFLPDHIQSECKRFNIATYSTYFREGSSGSPVFDEKCNLVAMHTGLLFADEKREHAIMYSIPLHSIIQNIIKQLASREPLGMMLKFIETAAQNPHLEEYLKELAEALMINQSERNAEMLASLYFEINRNGMWNLSRMIHEELHKIKENEHFQQILKKIDWLNKPSEWMKWMQCGLVNPGRIPS